MFIAPPRPRNIQQRQCLQPPGPALEQGLRSGSIPQPGITPGLPAQDISCLSCGIRASPAALSSFQHLSHASAPPPCSALGPRGDVFPFLNRFGEECAKEELHHSDAEGESADYIYPHRICMSEHNSTCAFFF